MSQKTITIFRTSLYLVLFMLMMGVVPVASAQVQQIENAEADFGVRGGKNVSDLVSFIAAIINAVLAIVSVIAVAAVIWGGIVYMTSGGDENKAATGKKVVLYAIIGLIIVAASAGIVNLVINVL